MNLRNRLTKLESRQWVPMSNGEAEKCILARLDTLHQRLHENGAVVELMPPEAVAHIRAMLLAEVERYGFKTKTR